MEKKKKEERREKEGESIGENKDQKQKDNPCTKPKSVGFE
jgi:hypothetical protein